MNRQDIQIQEILERLETGVREVYSTDAWRNYLRVLSKFHSYSVNNCLLIYMQKPEASMVAGYRIWNTEFHRQVRKGEKAIRIIAPVKRKVIKKDEEENTYRIDGFRIASVFDISQTYGDPVPVNLCENLQDQVDDYPLFIEALKLASPVRVRFEKTREGVNGFYSVLDEEIVINPGMSEAQTVKTLLHEIAHALLHRDNRSSMRSERVRREIEAESVACTVSSYYGIDTSSYSFRYIAAYAQDRELAQLKESMETIRQTSSELITLIRRIRNPVPGTRNKKPEIHPASLTQLSF